LVNSNLGTVPVSGTVKLNGQAEDGAVVSLSPKDAGLRVAVGKTDASGNFQLMTQEPGDGAMPGNYLVTITKSEGAPAPAAAPGSGTPTDFNNTASLDAAYKAKEAAGGTPPPKDLLPAKHKNPTTSGLTAEIPPGGRKDLNFELTP
jgi:hypothetical protein